MPPASAAAGRCLRQLLRPWTLFLLAAALAGCSVDATGLHVTVRTGGIAVDRLDVTVIRAGSTQIGAGSYTGNISDGETFGVQVPDALEGSSVLVHIDAAKGGSRVGSGQNT